MDGRILNAADVSSGLEPQQPLELLGIQPMTANNGTVQEQDRNVESMTALQNRVAVDIDDLNRRERNDAPKRPQLAQHLVAKLTVVPMHDCESIMQRAHQW